MNLRAMPGLVMNLTRSIDNLTRHLDDIKRSLQTEYGGVWII
jgi:hypothetical protein